MTLPDLITQALNTPDPKPFLFEVGQKVRVKRGVVKDGQTPSFWAGAVCVVIQRMASWLNKDHWYTLRHENWATDDFREEELDLRWCKRDEFNTISS